MDEGVSIADPASGSDSATDTASDSATDSESVPDPEPESATVPEPATESESDPEPEPAPESDPATDPEPVPDSATGAESEAVWVWIFTATSVLFLRAGVADPVGLGYTPAMQRRPKVSIFTDGGCKPNPGPGGWGAVLLFGTGRKKLKTELKGNEDQATNNRMELRAAIEALKSLDQPYDVELTTDSQYLRKGVTEWMEAWQRKGWVTASGSPVKNRDLWQELERELERHSVDWKWTRGHAGNRWNERADRLASSMIVGNQLPLDDDRAVHLFTSVAYSGKAKIGAWAVVLRFQEHSKTFSGREAATSPNRMHILAAAAGFEHLKRKVPVHVYTVSDYLADGATRWVSGWKARGWQTKEGKAVSHRDLWQQLDSYNQKYEVEYHVVGRDDLPPEMEEAKQLATEEVKKGVDNS